jgi:hypothetical protein
MDKRQKLKASELNRLSPKGGFKRCFPFVCPESTGQRCHGRRMGYS